MYTHNKTPGEKTENCSSLHECDGFCRPVFCDSGIVTTLCGKHDLTRTNAFGSLEWSDEELFTRNADPALRTPTNENNVLPRRIGIPYRSPRPEDSFLCLFKRGHIMPNPREF